MNAHHLIAFPKAQDRPSYRIKPALEKGAAECRECPLWVKSDMCSALGDARFVPIADCERRPSQSQHSAKVATRATGCITSIYHAPKGEVVS